MMPKLKPLFFLLPFLLLSLACRIGGLAPVNTSPTAIPGAPNQANSNEYYNPDYGVRLGLPKNWSTQEAEKGGYTIWFVNADGTMYSGLWIQAAEETDTPKSVAYSVRDEFLGSMTGVKDVRDEETTIQSGQPAWVVAFSGKTEKGDSQVVEISVSIHRTQAFLLISFINPDLYQDIEKDLSAFQKSMSLDTPVLFGGIPRNQALVYEGGESSNPREYDPATSHSSGDKLVFSGLVAFDPKLNLVPEMAKSWDVSEDGLVYTFHLRENARFHDGRDVTSQDVVYSWERAASPKLDSDTVLTYLGDIVGVKEMREGKAEHISGLKVIDDKTLQVTIDAPKPYFLMKLTYATAFVLDKANVESGEEWYITPNGTGPYKITRWEHFKVKVYEKNDDFYLGAPAIPYVVFRLYSGNGMRLYELGDIDVTGVSVSSLGRLTDPKEPLSKELIQSVGLCTSYVVFDVKQAPFDDIKVRQAFALAFDRQKYIDAVLDGVGIPAQGIYPPGLPGYDASFVGMQFDPERARQLLKESKYGSAKKLPPILFTDSGFGAQIGPSTAALAKMWKETLGVEISVENVEPGKYLDLLSAGKNGQIFDTGWCADYPDPENFADPLFHTGASQNYGHYSNPELDKILEQARVERDITKRMALYAQAQQIIVQDAAVIFTTHSTSRVLVKPYLKGYYLTPIDVPLERYMWLDYSNQP